jgi:hypothetical protein
VAGIRDSSCLRKASYFALSINLQRLSVFDKLKSNLYFFSQVKVKEDSLLGCDLGNIFAKAER